RSAGGRARRCQRPTVRSPDDRRPLCPRRRAPHADLSADSSLMTGSVAEREAKIVNPLGLHARPAAQLVRLAAPVSSDIYFSKDGVEVNGKSIMGVMMLAAECGSSLIIRATGADAEKAVQAIAELVATGFGEM